jgi:hypothetical protein
MDVFLSSSQWKIIFVLFKIFETFTGLKSKFEQMNLTKHIVTGLLFLFSIAAIGQNKSNEDLVQLSGVVATGDTLAPIPYCNIFIGNRGFGTVTDFDGFFSIVVAKGDSILFSHQGFKSEYFVVPDTLEKKHYSLIQILMSDTNMLPAVDLFPWPSKEQFKEYFLAMEVPMDDLDRAQRNLAMATIREQAAMMGYDANEMGRFMIENYNQQYYNAGRFYGNNGGQAILMSLSNPFAWAEFFRALNRGDFKRK